MFNWLRGELLGELQALGDDDDAFREGFEAAISQCLVLIDTLEEEGMELEY